MGTVLLLTLQCVVGVIATITDLRSGKIHNKHLALALFLGMGICTIFHQEVIDGHFGDAAVNAATSFVVAFMLFYTKFWSAGDAKLYCVLAALMPFTLYPQGLLFPAFYPLMIIFCLSFVYACLESAYYHVMDSRRQITEKRFPRRATLNKSRIVDWCLRYLSAALLLGVAYRVLGDALPGVVSRDRGLVMLTSVLLLILLYSRLRTRKAVCGVIAIGLLANIAYAVSTGTVSFGHLDVRTQVIALATIAVMYFAAKYDYMRIPVTGLRPGMILSIPTVAGFQGLRMPGLPSVTTETTDSRLSEEQVESIRGWGAATPDATHVVVVKHIPFAPFILAGTILYVLLSFAGVFGQ